MNNLLYMISMYLIRVQKYLNNFILIKNNILLKKIIIFDIIFKFKL